MSAFKAGQTVVFVGNGNLRPDWLSFYPKKGTEVVIHSLSDTFSGYLRIEGYLENKDGIKRAHFDPNHFRPLLGQDATKDLINSIIEVVETSEYPIKPSKQPQTA